MEADSSKEDKARVQVAARLHALQQAHQHELETILTTLAKIANLPIQQIEPHLQMLLERLLEPEHTPPPPNQRTTAFQEWVESHRGMNLPTLSDEAMSRESLYGERI